MGFFLSLIVIVAIQMIISFVLQSFGMPYLYIEMVTNLVLAFVFTYWNFSRVHDKKEVFKDISFHTNICIWYAILTAITTIGFII